MCFKIQFQVVMSSLPDHIHRSFQHAYSTFFKMFHFLSISGQCINSICYSAKAALNLR